MKNIIPEQKEGKQLDCFESLEFPSEAIADLAYTSAINNLRKVNHWYELAQIPSTVFQLTTGYGTPIDRLLELHDYIRLDIPGPGLPSSNGYDWVNVVSLISDKTDDYRVFAITLKPCPDPSHPGDKNTAHFFEGISSSTFLIEQRRNSILFQYAGRNEIINVDNENISDNVRNYVIGLAAKIGASYPQWKSLLKGMAHAIAKEFNVQH
ncbi:hypothetical protein K2F45_13940 [Sphingobacterium siyangense]|uniref:hypothetical protein n=1 Tax=Sphingobacterium TaxID=28453 RepID=UPI00095842E6|nr:MULTISPECIES: hypothetical protein [Sphingobacterium]APU97562.1 hypothetical protein BV902_15485 [Sphingobacterium sp. B29]UQA72939.1 hypothetical protein K2F45_13940 [Sphingobacterium siyangense]